MWVVSLITIVVLVGIVVTTIGVASLLHTKAAAAADLAALAAADAHQHGHGQDIACARAAEVAASNGAALLSCELDHEVVRLSVEVSSTFRWTRVSTIVARARAGPT